MSQLILSCTQQDLFVLPPAYPCWLYTCMCEQQASYGIPLGNLTNCYSVPYVGLLLLCTSKHSLCHAVAGTWFTALSQESGPSWSQGSLALPSPVPPLLVQLMECMWWIMQQILKSSIRKVCSYVFHSGMHYLLHSAFVFGKCSCKLGICMLQSMQILQSRPLWVPSVSLFTKWARRRWRGVEQWFQEQTMLVQLD